MTGEKSTYECHVNIMLHSGQAVRVCTPDGEWSNTNVTQCSSYAFMNLRHQFGNGYNIILLLLFIYIYIPKYIK